MKFTHQHILVSPLVIVASFLAITAPGTPAAASSVPRFEPAACAKIDGVEWLAHASCGYLVVPENRNVPNGRTIELMVSKYPAQLFNKRPDPVLYLEGGPGDIAQLEANEIIKANFLRDRDIYVVSQRGTWSSKPTLACVSMNDFARKLLGLRFYSNETKRAHLAATRACRDELTATGADLAAYNSSESAEDLADLRTVLGISQWNLFANSYGTYMAQTLMRAHPEGVRSVVLDSVVPTVYSIPGNWWNANYGFKNIFNACAVQTACNKAYPHLEATFTALVNKLEARPLTPTIVDPSTRKNGTVVIDGGALVDWLRNQTYSLQTLAAAPKMISGVAAGNRHAIDAVATDRASRAPVYYPGAVALGDGLAFGVSCREDYPFATPEELAAAGRAAFPNYPQSITHEAVGGWAYVNEDCGEVWKVPAAPIALHRPVASDIPTLVISGTFDTLTSLEWAKAATTRLSHATLISIPSVGHTVSASSPCARAVVVSFYAAPDRPPDISCVAKLKPARFNT
jgi:pimeloyl-ACP methyl ester carboxylesterase